MADAPQSPKTIAKLKTKDAVDRLRHGSPQFQNTWRQRCRDRIREKRGELFNSRRKALWDKSTADDLHDTLTEIVRQEFSDLSNMAFKDKDNFRYVSSMFTEEELLEIEKEILADEEWLLASLEQYEDICKSNEEMLKAYADQCSISELLCPICGKEPLQKLTAEFFCENCRMVLPSEMNEMQLATILESQADFHSTSCDMQPTFMRLPENTGESLNMICEACNFFARIT